MTAGRLIGRDAVLAVALRALDDAIGGSAQLLLLAGEAGIGKTAVLTELAGRARERGCRVLRGVCWVGPGAPAYWPWSQLLAALGAADLGTARRLVTEPPAVAQAASAGDGEQAADERFRLFDAVRTALRRASADTPLLLIIDDLHSADEASLRLLEFASVHLGDAPVLFALAYRDTEPFTLPAGVAERGQLLELAGLGPAHVATLVEAVAARAPDAEQTTQIWRRSRGNPFFVRELTRLMVARGEPPGASAPVSAIPVTVRDTLEHRLARLSQPCVELLEVAALSGPRLRTRLLTLVSSVDAGAVPALLAEATHARVLVPGDSAGELAFAHDLFRETIVAGLPVDRTAALHERIGRALEEMRAAGGDVEAAELADHFAAADPATAGSDAVRYGIAAAQAATARTGHGQAVRHLTAALRALDAVPDPDPDLRVSVLAELAAASARAGRAAEARDRYRQLAGLARQRADPELLARAALGIHALGARHEAAYAELVALLTDAAAALPPGATVTRSRVLASLARDVSRSGGPHPDQAVEIARTAVRLARESGDPGALADALLAEHDTCRRPGNARQRLDVLGEMIDEAGRAGNPEQLATAQELRASALLELGDPAGLAQLREYVRTAERLGTARGRYGALTRRATLALIAGQVDEAVALSAEALDLGRAIDVPDALPCFFALRGPLTALGGPLFDVPADELPATDPAAPVLPLMTALVAFTAGDHAAARDALRGYRPEQLPPSWDLEIDSYAAAAFAMAGSTEQRTAMYRRLTPHAGEHVAVGGCVSYGGAVDHLLGRLAAALGDVSVALGHLRAAHEAYVRLGADGWAQLCRADLAALDAPPNNMFCAEGATWRLGYAGRQVHVADAKGLHDIAVLLAHPDEDVPAYVLLGRDEPPAGADPILDDRARREFRVRIAQLDEQVERADARGDATASARAAEERAALVRELATATGLGGRTRRLGADSERVRKTVTARIRDSIARIERVHPELAEHLRTAISTGSSCAYRPKSPTGWQL
jgi:tetratricopeptide (TPR) repeat protein